MNRENEGPPPTPAPAPAPLLSAPAPSGVAMFAVPPSMSVQAANAAAAVAQISGVAASAPKKRNAAKPKAASVNNIRVSNAAPVVSNSAHRANPVPPFPLPPHIIQSSVHDAGSKPVMLHAKPTHTHQHMLTLLNRCCDTMTRGPEHQRVAHTVLITTDGLDSQFVTELRKGLDRIRPTLDSGMRSQLSVDYVHLPGWPAPLANSMISMTCLMDPSRYGDLPAEGFRYCGFMNGGDISKTEKDLLRTRAALEKGINGKVEAAVTDATVRAAEGEIFDPNTPDIRYIEAEIEAAVDRVLITERKRCCDARGYPVEQPRNVLIVTHSPQGVSAIASTLRHKLGYKLDLVDKPMPLEQREPAFGTARLSVTWKICLPYLIPDKKLMTAQVAKSMPQRRGMIIIAAAEVADLLECKNLGYVIMSPVRVSPGAYRSHGLEAAIIEFADGFSMGKAAGRLLRDPDFAGGYFIYSGSPALCNQFVHTDNRMAVHGRRFGLMDCLWSEAPSDPTALGFNIHDSPYRNTMLHDAHIMGLLDQSCTRYQMKNEIRRLSELLPFLHPQQAAFVLICVRAGLARQALSIVAIDRCKDRLYQQAAGRAVQQNHPSFEFPMVDVFCEAVGFMGHSSVGRSQVYHHGYSSEVVAIADMFSSFLTAIGFMVNDHELKWSDLGREGSFSRVPLTNWWSGGWSTANGVNAHGASWANANQGFFRNLPFHKLYNHFIKDEGRELFCDCIKTICRALYAGGFTHTEEIVNGPASARYNRHLLTDESPLLSVKGTNIFSGLLVMLSSNFGQYVGLRVLQEKQVTVAARFKVFNRIVPANKDKAKAAKSASNSSVKGAREKTGKYESQQQILYNKQKEKMERAVEWIEHATVHGFSTYQPAKWDRYCTYSRTDASPGGLRFHSRVHTCTLGQVAAFANILGVWDPYEVTEVIKKKKAAEDKKTDDQPNGGSKTDEQSLDDGSQAAFSAENKPFDWAAHEQATQSILKLASSETEGTEEVKVITQCLIVHLTGSPSPGQRLEIALGNEEQAAPIFATRKYLQNILKAAMSGANMTEFEEFINDAWAAYCHVY